MSDIGNCDHITGQHGRGFSKSNLFQMRAFYLGWEISQTPSAKFEARAKFQTLSGTSAAKKPQTSSAKFGQENLPSPAPILRELIPTGVFPLSWSHYVNLSLFNGSMIVPIVYRRLYG